MNRRRLIAAAALALCFSGAGATVVQAEEAPGGSPTAGDPFGGQTVPPGPVFVITPGDGSADPVPLPPPVEPSVAEEIVERDREAAQTSSATPTAATAPTTPGSEGPGGTGSTGSTATPEAVPASGGSSAPSSGSSAGIVAGAVVLGLALVGALWLTVRWLQGRRASQVPPAGSGDPEPEVPVP